MNKMKNLQSKDLRLGNFTSNGKVILIDADVFRVEDNEGDSFKNTWADIKPIPLTEEWLLKFGFEYETLFDIDGGEYYSYVKGQFMLYNSEYCDVFKCDLNENYDVDVTTVHQLQNLYFALTGEELRIKSE